MDKEEVFILVDKAVEGDRKSLSEVLDSVRDMVFNLSLRMLGTIVDAEDATQEILSAVLYRIQNS